MNGNCEIVLFGNERKIGTVRDGVVVDLQAAMAAYLGAGDEQDPLPSARKRIPDRLKDFIALGSAALDDLNTAADYALNDGSNLGNQKITCPLNNAQLSAPWPESRIACVGSNFARHSLGMRAGRSGATTPTIEEIEDEARANGQWGFFKVSDYVLGPNDNIPYPVRTKYLDYEGEIAVIIGRRGRNIKKEDALGHVWGITMFNDLSIRDDIMGTRPMSYNFAKNFDGSAALGPILLAGETDVQNVDIETRVNGELRQQFNTREMIFSFAEVIEYLSRDFTLVPGDVISGGTSAGTAQDSSPRQDDGTRLRDRFLKPGDVVELFSPALGVLRNVVVPTN